MRRNRGQGAHKPESQGMMRWLLTYSDMITLLLAFFVMLYSLAKVDEAKFQAIARELHAVLQGGSGALELGRAPIAGSEIDDGSLTQVMEALTEYLQADELGQEVIIALSSDRITLRLPDSLLFASGEATLGPKAQETLRGIARILQRIPNPVRIEGFTDDIPIQNSRYPSNWHLSAARAATVALFLVNESIDPKRLTALGYGEYRPLVPNTSAANRVLNRRVDLIVFEP